ncbi:MAG: hypothetical protein D6705_01175 [Deltaproteobacteria bacterium]|nr:MAG: hypothetical protein D6705_01175 [Deltaproteobacteria bacterium]
MIAIAATTFACKDPPPRPAAESAPSAAATRSAEPVRTPQEACGARPLTGLPLFDRPLGGRLGDLDLAPAGVELVRGGLAFVVEGGRLVVPVPGAGRAELRVLATPERLAGLDRLPPLRGGVHRGDDRIEPKLTGLRLDLSPMQDGRATGLVTLCFDEPGGYLVGRFEARADEDISDRPDPTRDHPSALRYVVDRALEAQGVAPAAIRHRGTHLDPTRGVGYDHVVAWPKAATPPPWSSQSFLLRKKNGAWTIVAQTQGNRIPETQAPTPPDDAMAPWVRAAAAAVEEKLAKSRLAGFASRIELRTPPKAGDVPERAVLLVTIRPDRSNGTLGRPRRYRVEAERRDGGVRVTKVVSVSSASKATARKAVPKTPG